MEKLHISSNSRYFVKKDGTPFIWLADTAWTMPQRLKWDDVDYYMKKRKRQGFTVLQIVALDPERDVEMRNPAGIKALINDDLLNPNEQYFQYLDWILDMAEKYEFYVLLLPVWGQLVVGDNWGGKIFDKTVTVDNAYEYGCWIGKRYKNRNNILWCLGGDRHPLHKGIDYKDVWRRMAEGLANGILNLNLKYNEPDEAWKKMMITYHASHDPTTGECSTMSYWTDEEAWIGFIMLQSGHGLLPKNFELVKKEYYRPVTMPVWDGEPAYEMMPSSWSATPDYHGDWIVRKRAFWSLFAGAFGHTYGHASVWSMIGEKEKNVMMKTSWHEALEYPGANQIKILRDFLESRNLNSCVPAQEMLQLQLNKEEDITDEHVQACRQVDGSFACVYFPSGGKELIDSSGLKGDSFYLWWFNPRDGKCYTCDNIQSQSPVKINSTNNSIKVKTPTRGEEQDWVLVIDAVNQEKVIPGLEKTYSTPEIEEALQKVFEW